MGRKRNLRTKRKEQKQTLKKQEERYRKADPSIRPAVRELALKIKEHGMIEKIKELRKINKELELTIEEQDYISKIAGEGKIRKLWDYLHRNDRWKSKWWRKSHPWMGNPYA